MSNKARRMLVLQLVLIILKEAGPTAACSSSCISECYCNNRNLTSVPQDLPTDITRLDLFDNAITTLNQSDFSRYRRLTRLQLQANQISMIHHKTFHNLTSLTILDLRYNHLSNLTAGMFDGLGVLEYLHLSHNQLSRLPADIFVELGNLKYLKLSYNQLTNLPADIFAGLGNLRQLLLDYNQLTNLTDNMFMGLSNVYSLYLSNNNLTSLSADIFAGLDNLRSLYLFLNHLTSLSDNMFVDLGNLETLMLQNNKLTSLPTKTFVGLDNLRSMLLYNNQLTSLPAGIFAGLGKLRSLYLSINQLRSLPADIFVGLGKLQTMNLNRNQLTSFPWPANISMGLGGLWLYQNKLETLPHIAYDILASISDVDIHNNPWQCDCRMAAFKQKMSGSYPFENQIRCAGPVNLRWQLLLNVSPEDLTCEETTPIYSTKHNSQSIDSTQSLPPVSSSSPFHQSAKSTSKALTLSPTPRNTPTADSTPGWSTVSSSPLFSPSAKSTSKVPTLSPTPSNTPTADSNPDWFTVSSSPPFNPSSTKSESRAPTLSPTQSNTPTADSNPGWSTVSTDSPSTFQSTMTESNTGPADGGIVLPVPILATLCTLLGLFIIFTIAIGICWMHKRRERDDPTPEPDPSADLSNPAGISDNGHDQIMQNADNNRQSRTSHIYDIPTDDPDTAEYNTIGEFNQSENPYQSAENRQSLDSFGYLVVPPSLPPENQTGPRADSHIESADAAADAISGRDTWTDEADYDDVVSPSQTSQPGSGQIRHLDSFNNSYQFPSPSLYPGEGPQSHKYVNSQMAAAAKDAAARPQVMVYENEDEIESAKEGPQSHKYVNSHVVAAAKDAAAGPQVIVYENDDESVDNQSQTAAAPGADSPHHYEPLRNPSSQQQHTYTSLMPHGLQNQ